MIRVELDQETYVRLVEEAVDQRRPIPWQAEVILRRALGLGLPEEISALNVAAREAVPA